MEAKGQNNKPFVEVANLDSGKAVTLSAKDRNVKNHQTINSQCSGICGIWVQRRYRKEICAMVYL